MLYRIVEVGGGCEGCIATGNGYYSLVPIGLEAAAVAAVSAVALGMAAWALSRDWGLPLPVIVASRIKRARVDDSIKASIISLLEERGPMTIYEMARELGVQYGAVRWHVYVLEREGVVKTEKRRGRTYVELVFNKF